MSVNPKTCIVVPTYDNEDFTIRCFKSIAKNTNDYLILWIDDCSNEASRNKVLDVINKNDIKCQLILNEKNLGFAKSVNKGIRKALDLESEYIVLQNNDTEVYEGWLDNLINIASKDEKIALVGPLVSPCEGFQSVDKLKVNDERFNDLPEFKKGQSLSEYASLLKSKFKDEYYSVDVIAFFSVLIKTKVVEKIGFISTEFGVGYGEDDDYCYRVKQNGLKTVLAKDTFIYHRHHATFNSKYSKDELGKIKNKNKNILLKKLQCGVYGNEEIWQLKEKIKMQEVELNSKSFRLGNLFFRSIKNPYKLIVFPINFVRILLEKK